MRHTFVLTATLALLAGAAQAQTKWDMPTPYPDGNFHTKNIVQFVEDVKKASNGKLLIAVHSNASLFKMPEIKRAVQTGQVAVGEVLVSALSNEDPIFAFESNPFLANNYDAAAKLWASARPYVETKLDKQGIKLLYSVPWPPQGIYAKKPLASVADLKGAKFRTYNPNTSRFAELLGAVPTTVQAAEIPQAFKTGLVDAMITSAATGVDTQAWDYLSHYYDTQAFLPQNVVVVNKDAFYKLDAATQKAVLDAAMAAEKRGWETSKAENARLVKTMADKGIKIVTPDAKLAAEFAAVGKTMVEEWAKKTGADGDSILAAFRK